MSTRGVYGFRIDGIDKLSYNHSDSYPSWLGKQIVSDLRQLLSAHGIDWLRDKARKIAMVDTQAIPTTANKKRLHAAGIAKAENVDDGKNWYAWLRTTQGDVKATLAVAIMGSYPYPDNEWGYIVNLDDQVLEVYEDTPHSKAGRYAASDSIANSLVASIPFTLLPEVEDCGLDAFLSALQHKDVA